MYSTNVEDHRLNCFINLFREDPEEAFRFLRRKGLLNDKSMRKKVVDFLISEAERCWSAVGEYLSKDTELTSDFWNALWERISRHPERSKEFCRILLEGFKRGCHKDVTYLWAAREYIAHNPEVSRRMVLNLYDFGHKHENYWCLIKEYISHHPKLSRDFHEIFLDGYRRGVYKYSNSTWGGWDRFDRHEYWSAVTQYVLEHGSPELLCDLFSLGAYEHEDYWDVLRNYLVGHGKNISKRKENSEEIRRIFVERFQDAARIEKYWSCLEEMRDNGMTAVLSRVLSDIYDTGGYRYVRFWLVRSHHPVLEALRRIEEIGRVDNYVEEIINSWKHKHSKYLRSLLRARAWYLRELLLSPTRYEYFIRVCEVLEKKTKVGKRTAKKIFENLPLFTQLSDYDLSSLEFKTQEEFFERAKRKLIEKYLSDPFVRVFLTDKDIKYLPHFLSYRKYEEAIRDLPRTEEELFNLKFAKIPNKIKANIRRFVYFLERNPLFIISADVSGMINALKEEARNEKLFERNDEYSKTIRRIYEKTISMGLRVELTDRERRALKNIKKAGEVGLKETVSKINAILEASRDEHRGRLRAALSVPQHFAYMNIPGSCMCGIGEHSIGAVAVTGGPALVVGVEDIHGTPVGRVLFTLWTNGKRYVFVPNHVYGIGGKELLQRAVNVLEDHNLKTHNNVEPPKEYKLAESIFKIKRFYKDGVGVVEFQ